MAIDIDHIIYNEAVKGMNDKARYKLKNFMAHGYDIAPVKDITVLERKGKTLMIDKNGDIWKAEKAT